MERFLYFNEHEQLITGEDKVDLIKDNLLMNGVKEISMSLKTDSGNYYVEIELINNELVYEGKKISENTSKEFPETGSWVDSISARERGDSHV